MLSRHPPGKVTGVTGTIHLNDENETPTCRTMRLWILTEFTTLFEKADEKLTMAQKSYKTYYDCFVHERPPFKAGDYVYINWPPNEPFTTIDRREGKVRTKLMSRTTGPVKVPKATLDTVTIEVDDTTLKLSVNRWTSHQTPESLTPIPNNIINDENDVTRKNDPLLPEAPQMTDTTTRPQLRIVNHHVHEHIVTYDAIHTDGTRQTNIIAAKIPEHVLAKYWDSLPCTHR